MRQVHLFLRSIIGWDAVQCCPCTLILERTLAICVCSKTWLLTWKWNWSRLFSVSVIENCSVVWQKLCFSLWNPLPSLFLVGAQEATTGPASGENDVSCSQELQTGGCPLVRVVRQLHRLRSCHCQLARQPQQI